MGWANLPSDETERLQARPDLTQHFVFITGGLLNPDTDQFLEGLPNERLEKPLGVQNLRAMVRRFVASRGR